MALACTLRIIPNPAKIKAPVYVRVIWIEVMRHEEYCLIRYGKADQ